MTSTERRGGAGTWADSGTVMAWRGWGRASSGDRIVVHQRIDVGECLIPGGERRAAARPLGIALDHARRREVVDAAEVHLGEAHRLGTLRHRVGDRGGVAGATVEQDEKPRHLMRFDVTKTGARYPSGAGVVPARQ